MQDISSNLDNTLSPPIQALMTYTKPILPSRLSGSNCDQYIQVATFILNQLFWPKPQMRSHSTKSWRRRNHLQSRFKFSKTYLNGPYLEHKWYNSKHLDQIKSNGRIKKQNPYDYLCKSKQSHKGGFSLGQRLALYFVPNITSIRYMMWPLVGGGVGYIN